MKKNNNQFDICEHCGRYITGEVHTVGTKLGNVMVFHKDPLDCAKAPEVREVKKRGEGY